MRWLRRSTPVSVGRFQAELRVLEFIASRPGDLDRGPLIILNSHEARIRLLEDSELVWIQGPRYKAVAPLEIDDRVPNGGAIVRDIIGVAPSEVITVTKPDYDSRTV